MIAPIASSPMNANSGVIPEVKKFFRQVAIRTEQLTKPSIGIHADMLSVGRFILAINNASTLSV